MIVLIWKEVKQEKPDIDGQIVGNSAALHILFISVLLQGYIPGVPILHFQNTYTSEA